MKIHIIVADTIGDEVLHSPEYIRLLPGVQIHGYRHPSRPDTAQPPNMHGAWCGWLAGVPLVRAQSEGHECHLHFVPVFSPDAKFYPGAMEFLLDHIEKIHDRYEPDQLVVSRSFGAWDGDDWMRELIHQANFEVYKERWEAVEARTGFVDVSASGNLDNNDEDNDIGYPQRLMARSLIIGSHNRAGIPSTWSGDGAQLLGLFWGEGIKSPNLDGTWTQWQGTSASCPKCAGCVAANLFDYEQAVDWFKSTPDFPRKGDRPHPKYGWGSREQAWQDYLSAYPPVITPDKYVQCSIDNRVY